MVNPAASLALLAGGQGGWPPGWASVLARFGPLALGALAALVLLRALLRHHRYRAARVLGDSEQSAVRATLVAAESRTIGEIVPVVVERSDSHPQARWIVALGTLLLGSALLASWLPWGSPALLLLCQAGLGALGWAAALALPDLQRLVISEQRATHVAEEQAVQEFHRQGLARTRDRTGVLLFVSLLERRVIVLGDEGIHARVGDEHWTATTAAVLDGIARGSLRDGLVAGIERCGAVLAEHFPARPGDRNELADRLVVRRQ